MIPNQCPAEFSNKETSTTYRCAASKGHAGKHIAAVNDEDADAVPLPAGWERRQAETPKKKQKKAK